MKCLFLGIAFILAGICFACLGLLFITIPGYVIEMNKFFALGCTVGSAICVTIGLFFAVYSIRLPNDK